MTHVIGTFRATRSPGCSIMIVSLPRRANGQSVRPVTSAQEGRLRLLISRFQGRWIIRQAGPLAIDEALEYVRSRGVKIPGYISWFVADLQYKEGCRSGSEKGSCDVTITKMTELYRRGAYSPINYYLGLVELIREGADLDQTHREVPEPLLEKMVGMARKHRGAADEEKNPGEQAITGMIIEWDEKRLSPVSSPGMSRHSSPPRPA